MEQVFDYYPDKSIFRSGPRSNVWVTEEARKEMEDCVGDNLGAILQGRSEKGFQGYVAAALRPEGDGVWALGASGGTDRICGFFTDEKTRKNFVIGGAWKGKSGPGNPRPHHANAIVARVEKMKKDGVRFPQGVERVAKEEGPTKQES